MKLRPVKLPNITASGQRDGWWLLVKALAPLKRQSMAGFAGFEGERLAPGVCELPPLSVLILVRPTGSARADVRKADVMYVSPTSDDPVGIAFGLEWVAGESYGNLRKHVHAALVAQEKYNTMSARLDDAAKRWAGEENNSRYREAVAAEVSSIIQCCVPHVWGLEVGPDPTSPDCIRISATLSSAESDRKRLIKCLVPYYDSDGESDFWFVNVRVPYDYINFEEDDGPNAHHHQTARAYVRAMGGHADHHTPVYDDETDRWGRQLLAMFDFESGSTVDLGYKEVDNG